MKITEFFIRKFSFSGGKIFRIFEQACFRNVTVTDKTELAETYLSGPERIDIVVFF